MFGAFLFQTVFRAMTLTPVATVYSCFGGKFAVPRQPGLCPSASGRLVFDLKFRSVEAIRGLDGFSHIWLIFGFHETTQHGWTPTVRPPRLGGNRRVGVFASRSTFRPNNLGLSLVRLEGVELDTVDGPVLLLGGLDLIDRTPVYDIKPYLAYAESIPGAASGFAAEEIPRFVVEVAAEAAGDFSRLPERSKNLVLEALALGPRPAAGSGDPNRIYGALLCGCNIRFTVGCGICRIVAVEWP